MIDDLAFHFTSSNDLTAESKAEEQNSDCMSSFVGYESDSDLEDNDREDEEALDKENTSVASMPRATIQIHVPDVAYRT